MALLVMMAVGCGNRANTETSAVADADAGEQNVEAIAMPGFDADSAYRYVAEQIAFGPRVPGTDAHSRCGAYIVGKLKGFGADSVWLQTGEVVAATGVRLPVKNIMARFNSQASKRILIAAHYDTRPWADEDADESNRNKAIDGANDGASGVGVALELARNIGISGPEIGVDFLLTDVEDYGAHDDENSSEESTWALGSKVWAQSQPYEPRERPAFGILLDMVGGRDAKFYREFFSEQMASWVNAKVWRAAEAEGIDRFVNQQHGAVTDDHLNIARAGIPCIDIIECGNSTTGSFPPYWHTLNDNLQVIDPATLSDVGRTLIRVIYTEPL